MDLFSQDAGLERLSMPGADVFHLRHLELGEDDRVVLHRLISETPWRQEHVTIWGKRHLQPRLIAWYGDEGRTYSYSTIALTPLPWTELLLSLRGRIEEASRASFNSVLLNYYRDNNDSMGFHSDDEPELGSHPIIASLSLGDTRIFVFKHKTDKGVKPVRLALSSGHLLVMKGDTQRNWQHGIMKESRRCGPRVNLTFRQIV